MYLFDLYYLHFFHVFVKKKKIIRFKNMYFYYDECSIKELLVHKVLHMSHSFPGNAIMLLLLVFTSHGT